MRIKVIILFFLVIGFCQFRVFPEISSRIEGEIVDKDTGLPIKGAWVNLFDCNNPIFKNFCDSYMEQETDSKGVFKFDKIGAGQYFLVVVHRSFTVLVLPMN